MKTKAQCPDCECNFKVKDDTMHELQMPKDVFYAVLKNMLQMHEVLLQTSKKYQKQTIKLYGSLPECTVNHYDDFYEFLEHWKDYKDKKWEN